MRMFDDSEDDAVEAVAQQDPDKGQQTVSANTDVFDVSGVATSSGRAEGGSSKELDFLNSSALKQRNTVINGWGSVPSKLVMLLLSSCVLGLDTQQAARG